MDADDAKCDLANLPPLARLALLTSAPPEGVTPAIVDWAVGVAMNAASAVLSAKLETIINGFASMVAFRNRSASAINRRSRWKSRRPAWRSSRRWSSTSAKPAK